MNTQPSISNELKKNDFYYRNIYNIRICLRGVSLIKEINNEKGIFNVLLNITNEHYKELNTIEKFIEQQLKKTNLSLNSELKNKNSCICRLKTIKSTIKTDIRNNENIYSSYSDIPLNHNFDIIISLDNMWSHKNYYPLHTYKWKIDEIKI